MEKFKGFAVFAENLKSFGSKRQGFEVIRNINIIVGRNNSGKSSLIDIIEYATDGTMVFQETHSHQKLQSKIVTETLFTEEDAHFFPLNAIGGDISRIQYQSHYDYGITLVGGRLLSHIVGPRLAELIAFDSPVKHPKLEDLHNYKFAVMKASRRNPLEGLRFYRLAAERNITPEADAADIRINSNGVGATNMIQNFINKSHLPSYLVEKTLLGALNEVFAPDTVFTDIVCQHHATNHWEIFLEEENKGRIALSQSGSGLKTTILVLCYIHLLPTVLKEPLNKFVFAFEELENNLHPALQRRLLSYLAAQSVINDFPIFLTTHSSVAIDMFSRRNDAQIVHVTHDGKSSVAKKITTYIESRGVLDDLDLRASDLLQANGIIWVEGPSDRIYLNTWISLISDGSLIEGVHYQCVFYGGRLLSHLSADSPDEKYDGIPLLTINRNAAIIIDSDKKAEESELNNTKKRILHEFDKFSGFSWVTDGREIENYTADSLLKKWLSPEVKFKSYRNKYSSFFKNLNSMQSGLGDRYERKKALLAEELSALTCIDDIRLSPELFEKMTGLCNVIRNWNKISENI